jgi:hypothetical protein
MINAFYKAADATYSSWPVDDDNHTITARKSRKSNYKASKFQANQADREAAAAENMGEDAAEASAPGKGKAKTDGEGLAGKLGKTNIKDNTMLESNLADDDEDPVRQPGWRRGGYRARSSIGSVLYCPSLALDQLGSYCSVGFGLPGVL